MSDWGHSRLWLAMLREQTESLGPSKRDALLSFSARDGEQILSLGVLDVKKHRWLDPNDPRPTQCHVEVDEDAMTRWFRGDVSPDTFAVYGDAAIFFEVLERLASKPKSLGWPWRSQSAL